MRLQKEFEDSTVAKILDLVENASSRKANAENFITKFSRYYTPVVVIAAVLLAVIPPVVPWYEFLRRLERMGTPCTYVFWLFPVLVHLLFLFLWDSSAELAVHQNGVYL